MTLSDAGLAQPGGGVYFLTVKTLNKKRLPFVSGAFSSTEPVSINL